MDFRLLGPMEVETDGQPLTPTRPRERAVLALLLLRSGTVIGADELIEAVWGEEPPATARTALQGVVSALRRRLGTERIETRGRGYRLALQPGDAYDVAQFERLAEQASRAAPADRSVLLREAVALFRGEPLADVELMLPHEVARLQELRLRAEEALISADLELGRHFAVIPRLERLVAEQPLREGLRGQLMLAMYRADRQADALRVAQDARRVLAMELGVEPGPALQRLERQILEHDPALRAEGEAMAVGAEEGAAVALERGTPTLLAVDGQLEPAVRQQALGAADRHGAREVPSPRGTVLAFARAREAAVTAAAIQRRARLDGPGLRIGVHSCPGAGGELAPAESVRQGVDRATRLAAAAHPGQVILSRESRDLLREAPLHEVGVRDLGEHRLADLGPAQPLYQLVASGLDVDFPPTAGLESRATNLPMQPTQLIGRQDEVGEVVALLRDPDLRLVTLTGPGGTGKTRLAIHAAAELLDDAPDGAWFVALDAVADPSLVGSTIATVMGLRSDAGSPLAWFPQELRNRRILLVLDNFEHLLRATDVVAELLQETANLKVLVTSRVPLKLAGEREVAVPPLPAPPADVPSDVGELLGVASVALFVARARAVRPEFALTADNAPAITALCRTLDGLPLAIELAASQVAFVPPAGVLDRLDRSLRRLPRGEAPGPERHRALQVAIDWSHDLLDGDTRSLFADLAVFAGGWTLDAAEVVLDGGRDVIAGTATLVDHSLVRVGGTEAEPRFGMLETIREYASARLDASGLRGDVERRHAAYFQVLADSAEPHLRGNPGAWIARLEREHDNLRAAIDRLARSGDAAAEAQLVGTLWRFWYLAGHLGEGRRRLDRALAVHREPTPARARVLIGAAVMAVNTMEPGTARQRAEEALQLCRDLGDRWGAAYAQMMLGAALGALDDAEGARAMEEESLRAFRELGDEHSALLVSRNLAGTLEELGDRAGAEELFQDNLRRARAEQNGRLEASTLGALATIAFDAGRVADASVMLRESLRLHRQLGDRLDTAVDLGRAARLLAMAGPTDVAARLVGVLGAIQGELGSRGRMVASMAESAATTLGRQIPESDYLALVREGEALSLEAAVELALDALR